MSLFFSFQSVGCHIWYIFDKAMLAKALPLSYFFCRSLLKVSFVSLFCRSLLLGSFVGIFRWSFSSVLFAGPFCRSLL